MKRHTHDQDGDIPDFLCRLCHPELNMSAERRQELDDAEREQNKKLAAILAKRRAIETTERKLATMTRRPLSQVGDKIATGLVKKLSRLKGELTALEPGR